MVLKQSKRRTVSVLTLTCLFAALGVVPGTAQAPKPKPEPEAGKVEQLPGSDAGFYCKNIADKATDARIAWQTWQLVGLEAKLRERAAELERKEAEYKAWVKRREKLLENVEGQVVSIIARMRPEMAAAQLSTSDEETATGVLLKLKPRVASEILDEMEPAQAARLTQLMVGFSDPLKEGSF